MSEPNSKFNDLSSETVTKLVSMIVAIVVFAVVLVPIVNGLADGNSDNGGNSGTQINDLQTTYSDFGVDIPFKSYESYVITETPTLPHAISYSLDDLLDLNDSLYGTDGSYYLLMGFEEMQGLYIYIGSNDDSRVYVNSDSLYLDYQSSETFTFTINTDYSYEIVGYSQNTESVKTYTGSLQWVSFATTSANGYVPYWCWITSNDFAYFKMGIGSTIQWKLGFYIGNGYSEYVFNAYQFTVTNNMISDNLLTLVFDGTSNLGNTYNITMEIPLNPTDDGYYTIEQLTAFYNTMTVSAINALGEGVAISPSQNLSGMYDPYLSTYVGGNGSDSAGISGTAGTILKIIPVLVGVGVILAIVALFYDPRNLIKKN